jgi:hypothetical protein
MGAVFLIVLVVSMTTPCTAQVQEMLRGGLNAHFSG